MEVSLTELHSLHIVPHEQLLHLRSILWWPKSFIVLMPGQHDPPGVFGIGTCDYIPNKFIYCDFFEEIRAQNEIRGESTPYRDV